MDRRLELLSELPPVVWVHMIAAVVALITGALVLWRKKGDSRHRFLGRTWVILMLVVAGSSFWIREINDGGFSPIHLLSVWTFYSIAVGVIAIRSRAHKPDAISQHSQSMQSLYVYGMLIAGGFTFLPDRLLGRLTFGETFPMINYALVAILALIGVWFLLRFRRVALPSRG